MRAERVRCIDHVLGLRDLDFWASVGFILVALTTLSTGLEAFFNWRSRWILAEEAQGAFYRLDDDLKNFGRYQ